MLRKIIFLSGFLLLLGNGYGQAPDATVILHQNMLNAFLSAVGPVSGKSDYNVMGAKGQYTWTLSNARIELKQGQAQFFADANVKAGPISYNAPAAGSVEIKYDPVTNRIRIKVVKAEFEIYTKIFGKKIHIANVDAANFYRPEFEFAGPKPIQAKVDVKLPDGSVKTIYIQQVSQNLTLEDHQVVVSSRLAFSDRPPQGTGESR